MGSKLNPFSNKDWAVDMEMVTESFHKILDEATSLSTEMHNIFEENKASIVSSILQNSLLIGLLNDALGAHQPSRLYSENADARDEFIDRNWGPSLWPVRTVSRGNA
jgi:hypothetical protein